jgi:hypothetical protein
MNTLEYTNVRRKMWVFEGLEKEGEWWGVCLKWILKGLIFMRIE